MKNYYPGNSYVTPTDKLGRKVLTRFGLFIRIMKVVIESRRKAISGEYDDDAWNLSSYKMLRCFEKSGITSHFSGMDNIEKPKQPVVFIGNHMSLAETFLLPGIIVPRKKVTFVVKKELCEYPLFGPIMRSRNPIAVNRKNSKKDFMTVMNDGVEKLKSGVSLIIFPQSTRMGHFSAKNFNTIGIKLARKAGVPIIPFALRTDCWKNGLILKDFGSVKPERDVFIEFSEPIDITGNGKNEHQMVIDFIKSRLLEWDCPIND